MTITGAQFTEFLISRFERFLDSANAKPSHAAAMKNKGSPQVPFTSSETTSGATSVDGTESPPAVDDDAEMSLRKIIVTYTGLSPAEIARDASIGDMGVVSLAAVELAEELQTQFGKEIVAEDLLMSSYGALSDILVPFSWTKKGTLPRPTTQGPQAAIPIHHHSHSRPLPASTLAHKTWKVTKLL
ncbi:hypothetical protein ABVK25_011948 [Lepraria finkii]|uniref:Carrier domain-containing protein n=1 Tax=Lepraria finkii TaxID=1340010 RepID=A0ABR4AK65_9LECA